MIQDLQIIHRRKPHSFDAVGEALIWSTCLRSLAFTAQPTPHADDEIFRGQKAYRFLLEVICGLHSPMLGETEVFGQFKAFSQIWQKAEPRRAPLIQRLLNDAKAIRSQYLRHLGHQSYGSWVRKNLRAQRVHVIGAGSLAREILPYLIKQNRDIVLHVRNPQKADFPQLSKHSLSERRYDHGAVLVVAPLSAHDIESWLNGAKPEQVIDLRDNSAYDRLQDLRNLHTLTAIFAEIEKTRADLQPRLKQAQQAIIERGENAERQLLLLRPQGWDDLCA